jgi:hypothetical protein
MTSTNDTADKPRRIVAIHQPNFFPWLGYFDKIAKADVFVFLDDVAMPRSHGSSNRWPSRVGLFLGGRQAWISCPLRASPHGTKICDLEIDETQPWRRQILRRIKQSYERTKNFKNAFSLVESFLDIPGPNLAAFNIACITALVRELGIEAEFVRQIDIPYVGTSNQMNASLVQAVRGTSYLVGGGADGYQDDSVFSALGIEVVEQNYTPHPYGPQERFIPGLSVIDYLMHDGRALSERVDT